ncbi:MAG: hypothetical protein H8E30_19005 [Alphaproteobacteria bacterium]|nr:hypothetical protein [Alphaproteobacteria bacterium]
MSRLIPRTSLQGLLWAVSGLLAALPLTTPPAFAAVAPTAIVEDADPGRSDIGLFEMLESGRTIALKKGERLVLGYLQSCIQETILGGQVLIGKKESTVSGSQITRQKVECTGGQVTLDKSTKGKAGVVVFRKAPKRNPRTLTMRDTSPLVHLTAPVGKIYLRRLDQPGPAKAIGVSGSSVDLRAAGITLAPGGSYEIAANGRRVRLDIAPNAGHTLSLLGRLVVL